MFAWRRCQASPHFAAQGRCQSPTATWYCIVPPICWDRQSDCPLRYPDLRHTSSLPGSKGEQAFRVTIPHFTGEA